MPVIDSACCCSCGLCVRACPSDLLDTENGRALVARPAACDDTGIYELICPAGAVQSFHTMAAPDSIALDHQGVLNARERVRGPSQRDLESLV